MMNWSDEWKKIILESSLREKRQVFTSKEFIAWYDLQLEHNNYPGVLLAKVQKDLDKHSTVLDIGAGTGAFAVPLAQVVKKVTVVEPSKEMCLHLQNKTKGLHIINQRWEDVSLEEVGQHDVVIAAHSLYDIIDIKMAMEKMLVVAKKRLYIIMGSGKAKVYTDIWRHFKKDKFQSSPSFIHLYNVLYELGVLANVELVKISQDQVYRSINQAVTNWQMRLDLEPAQEGELRNYLLNRLVKDGEKYYLPGEGRNAVISVELTVDDGGEIPRTHI